MKKTGNEKYGYINIKSPFILFDDNDRAKTPKKSRLILNNSCWLGVRRLILCFSTFIAFGLTISSNAS